MTQNETKLASVAIIEVQPEDVNVDPENKIVPKSLKKRGHTPT